MTDLEEIFPGDNDLAHRLRGFDWSGTPLGSPETWSSNLRSALGEIVGHTDRSGQAECASGTRGTPGKPDRRVPHSQLQHTVRNILAVTRSLVRRTAANSETAEEMASHLEGRLDALARVQNFALLSSDQTVDLEYLVAEEIVFYNAREGEQVFLSGPPIKLSDRAAELFGLAIHELATNAVKFGALTSSSGHISIHWELDEAASPSHLRFHWEETDVDIAGEEPARQGYGFELLQSMLAYELRAQTSLRLEPDGLKCTIEMPLTSKIVPTGA
ncbi:two-component system, chemotaxis family, CheB/CheR fusion protein [Faunimonas pinastri]|uniref:histidine kinase n=1 Tax=Faunimonas pinastri TaxID=1855383 RepID=A0A1H9LIZ2_9HYPH|nr:sensor histidine kinase [Faunimonas pinastri]SER11199.1 two-component system, chemotaxis family, CheB/CheR fusion protein [Faunimonas pinastri]